MLSSGRTAPAFLQILLERNHTARQHVYPSGYLWKYFGSLRLALANLQEQQGLSADGSDNWPIAQACYLR